MEEIAEYAKAGGVDDIVKEILDGAKNIIHETLQLVDH